ncbi:hypothetical protein HD553DRAFT_342487 [Filobasidium floriforme]|uniref:uncharacterized protein n=1 Tax=Filobasidium floriforme TaxID=5210 RepID=UPI001E8D90D3|nr:uncharacterized protein HD553DRAFT_342487 [Filobasidium floriforme]KAH8084097.1 hypothetical protein HD553DRAFT_342487 [Filobasidium floriforme]
MNRRFRGSNSKPLALSCLVGLLICLAILVRQRAQSRQQRLDGDIGEGRPGNTGRSSQYFAAIPGGDYPRHAIRPNTHGLLVVPKDINGPHPIEGLLAEAEAKAKAIEKKNKDILYLRDAVRDYEQTYGMKPPRGFEKWYHFARDHRSYVAPSLYPIAHQSVLPYLSYPASLLRSRLSAIENVGSTFTFEFDFEGGGEAKSLKRGGALAEFYRTDDNELLLKPLLPYIPEPLPGQPNLKLYFAGDDGPSGQSHHEVVEKSIRLAHSGRTWSSADLSRREASMQHTFGWSLTCPAGSPLRRNRLDVILNDAAEASPSAQNKSFINDIMASYDYCYNPKLWEIHGTLIEDRSRGAKEMVPRIATCKLMHNTDVLGVPLDAVNQTIEKTAWEDKTVPKAFWRGSLTGAFHNDRTNWRKSQRERLCYKVKEQDTQQDVMVDMGEGKVETRPYDIELLNDKYLDVAPVGGAVQIRYPLLTVLPNSDPGECEIVEQEFDYGGRIAPKDTLNVVLKSTAFPEWFSHVLVPWYHYVPVQVDYSDIYDIMAYFTGPPDGSGVAHDNEAKNIAQHAYDFTQKRMRWVDMQSYTLLLALEWNRMLSDDREAATYVKAEGPL